jgi:vitamin B12 transporter
MRWEAAVLYASVRRICSTPLTLTLTVLIPCSAPAQGRDTVRLRPVVVTATRVSLPLDAVAAAVTVLQGAELRARGLRTVAEALRAVPGATVVETGAHGGQTSLFVRGGESDYVKVLLDGVPLNQAGGAFDFAHLTLDNVDRIEVVRGPASVLYGSDAVTGVIQIFTRAGGGTTRLQAGARAGTYGVRHLSADVAGGGAAAAFSAAASHFSADGLYPYNNAYRNTTLSGRLQVAPDRRTALTVAYRLGDDVYHFPTDGAGRPVDSNKHSAERGPSLSLTLDRSLGRDVRVQALAALREQRIAFTDEPDSPGEDGRFESRDRTRRATAGVLLHWRPGSGSVLTAGVEYEDESQRGRSVFEASFGAFPDSIDVRRWNRAAYAQVLLGVHGALAANLGVRAEDNSQFGGYATWRAGLVYRVDAATRLRASAGTGFKEPTFFENFATGFVQGDPSLAPERSVGWEVGVEHTVGGMTFSATYFDQRFRDLIEFTFTPPAGSSNYFNVAGATTDGVEATVATRLGAGTAASLAYTYLDSRVREPSPDGDPDALFVAGQSLLRRPAHSLSAQASVPVGRRALVVADARLVGRRDDLDFSRPPGERRVTLRAYGRVSLSVEYDLVWPRRGGPGISVTFRVENVTNDRSPEIANFPVRGRSLLFGGRVSYGS